MQRQGLLHHFQIRLSECCLEPITVSNWYFTSHIVWDYELRSIPSFLVRSLEVEGQIRSQDSICAQRKWTNWTILISTVPQSIGMKMCTLKAAHRPSRLVKYLLCQTWIGNNLWSSLMYRMWSHTPAFEGLLRLAQVLKHWLQHGRKRIWQPRLLWKQPRYITWRGWNSRVPFSFFFVRV